MIIGHKRVVDFFDRAFAQERVSHAYLLVGVPRIGKRTLAEALSARLLTVAPERVAMHPDFLRIERGTDEKTGKRKKDITAEQIITLRSVLARHALHGGYQCAVIRDAETMSTAAANALLKTLEEPRDRTVLWLTASDETSLPETILSRCQTLYLSPVADEDVMRGLEERGVAPDRAQELARAARGIPGMALIWAENPDVFTVYGEEVSRFRSLWHQPFYKKRASIEGLFGDGTDHIAGRELWEDVLAVWELTARDMITGKERAQAPVSTILAVVSAIRDARRWIGENIHPRLLVEHILLEIP